MLWYGAEGKGDRDPPVERGSPAAGGAERSVVPPGGAEGPRRPPRPSAAAVPARLEALGAAIWWQFRAHVAAFPVGGVWSKAAALRGCRPRAGGCGLRRAGPVAGARRGDGSLLPHGGAEGTAA